jgi:hypothetical protein
MAFIHERNREWFATWAAPNGRRVERRLPVRNEQEARTLADEIELLAREVTATRPASLARAG